MVYWQPANIYEHTINLQQDTTHNSHYNKKERGKITQEQLLDILTESVGTSH